MILGRLPQLVLFGLTLAVVAPASAQRIVRWVDANGVVHYGHHVPPEFATRDRDILNGQAVLIGREQGEVTAAERAEMARLEAEEADRLRDLERTQQRDRILLDTYLTIADIEDLRDRRIELIESQIKVTEFYLNNLRRQMAILQDDASAARSSAGQAATGVPASLALEISRTTASINLYEDNLQAARVEQESVWQSFESDIERFRELKGDDAL